jgi:hypothetical protein
VPIHHDVARSHKEEEHRWYLYCDRYPVRCTSRAMWPHEEFKIPLGWILVDAREIGQTPKEQYMCFCCIEHMEVFAHFKQATIKELPDTSVVAFRLSPKS